MQTWVIPRCLHNNVSDGKQREVFPRILTDSSDYPERYKNYIKFIISIILIIFFRAKKSGVRPLSKQLCITCETGKNEAIKLGLKDYSAQIRNNHRIDSPILQKKVTKRRKIIFQQGKGVRAQAVEKLLGLHSLVPVEVSTLILYVI